MLKICGLRDPENIREVLSLQPDMIGLIFYPGSPRYVSDPYSLIPVLQNRKQTRLAGVFVDADLPTILEMHNMLSFDIIQFHGQEEPELLAAVKDAGLTTIKAIGVASEADLEAAYPYEQITDYLLFDTKSSQHGGSGRRFGWQILDQYTGTRRFLVGGGIGVDDEPDIRHPLFAGLDINSRFEDQPGLKNPGLIEQFMRRNYDEKQ